MIGTLFSDNLVYGVFGHAQGRGCAERLVPPKYGLQELARRHSQDPDPYLPARQAADDASSLINLLTRRRTPRTGQGRAGDQKVSALEAKAGRRASLNSRSGLAAWRFA